MTRVAQLVNLLRVQRIEIGQATGEIKTSDGTFPAGSYVIKRDQPYGRLAKNLLERQRYPDASLRTYDDSGWTMGLAMLVDVRSEERRVGKECRSRGAPDQYEKKKDTEDKLRQKRCEM